MKEARNIQKGLSPLHLNAIYSAAGTGIEPAISAVTVQHVTNNTSQPIKNNKLHNLLYTKLNLQVNPFD